MTEVQGRAAKILAGRAFEIGGRFSKAARELLESGEVSAALAQDLLRHAAAFHLAVVLLKEGQEEEAIRALNHPHRMRGYEVP